MPRRIEFRDIGDFQATAMIHEENQSFYKQVAETKVVPIINRLKEVYYRHGKRYGWNKIFGIGMALYSLQLRGATVDIEVARRLNAKHGLPDDVLRDIVAAVTGGQVVGAGAPPGL